MSRRYLRDWYLEIRDVNLNARAQVDCKAWILAAGVLVDKNGRCEQEVLFIFLISREFGTAVSSRTD